MKRLSGEIAFAPAIEPTQEALDAQTPVPAHDARRNFVAEREHQHGRVVAELADLLDACSRSIVPAELPIVEKRDVLRPRQPDHDAQPVARRFVEQVAPRRRVDADGVDAELRHQAEVFGDLRRAAGTDSRRRRARTCRR